jgi:DNA-binding NtrC family response regulator
MEFSRLGSNRLVPLRARLIFATNRDLAKMVAEGKFRQDLYYRINVMQIDSPSLQEHREDIPKIAKHLLDHYSRIYEKPVKSIERDALAMLQKYAWPGNVRELENVMQRAIILASGPAIRKEDLAFDAGGEDSADLDNDSADLGSEDADLGNVVDIGSYLPGGSFEELLSAYKIQLAVSAVRENNGNRTLAARRLGISRVYLHRLIRLADPDLVLQPGSRQQLMA